MHQRLKSTIRGNLPLFWLLLALAASVIASFCAGFELHMKVPVLPTLLWLLALLLILFLAGRHPTTSRRQRLQTLFWFTLFTLAAFYWRIFDVAHIPQSLSGDEGSAGLFALSFLHGEIDNPFIPGWYGFPSLFGLLQSGSILLFGQTIFALRVFSALAGALTAGAVYWLGKELFSHRVGLLAAIFMTGFAFAIHFSRIALNNVWDGLFFCLTLTLLWKGWKRESPHLWALAGLCLGLSLYFYETSKLLLLLSFLWGLILALSNPQKLKRNRSGVLFLLLAFLTAFFPLLRYYATHLDTFWVHGNRSIFTGNWMQIVMSQTGQSEAWIVVRQALIGLGAFLWHPLDYFYKPGTAMLLPAAAVLFAIGLLFCLRMFRDPRAHLLLLWVLLFSLLGGFTENAPSAQRYVAAAPVCALGVALGINWLIHGMARLKFLPNPVLQGTAILLALILCWVDIHFYFQIYTPQSDFGGIGAKIETDLAENLNKIPGPKNVYYWGYPLISYGSLQVLPFLAPNAVGTDMDQFALPQVTPPVPDGPTKVFVFLNSDADLSSVEQQYPGGTLLRQQDHLGRFLFWQYTVIDPH
jgi:4-amino-4-deoxy-L-arabinose transferase-like glycosyltransferase